MAITKDGHTGRRRNIYRTLIAVIIMFALILPSIPVMPVFAMTTGSISGEIAGLTANERLEKLFFVFRAVGIAAIVGSIISGVLLLFLSPILEGGAGGLKHVASMFRSGVFIYALSVVLKKIIPKTMNEELQIPVIPKISVSSVILLLLVTATIILFLVYLFLTHQTLSAARNNGLHDEDDEHKNEENEDVISHDEFGLENYRAELRGYRKRLQDKDIVNQLQQMEDTLGWIIKTTEDDPDTVFMVRRLLEYYMPKTSNLLKTYADIERCPQKGENISNIMAEVKEALELLNGGMHNILDNMYQGKEMDISSDISVMKEMMVQDGMQKQYPDFHPGT